MSDQDDLDWLDSLAGRDSARRNETGAGNDKGAAGISGEAGGLDGARQRAGAAAWEAHELRLAVLARAMAPHPEVPAQDAERETDLLERARRDGLLVNVSELADNPFARRSSWRSVFRGTGARAMGAAALAVAVLALGWHLRPPAAPEEVFRGSTDGVVHLEAADPRALKQRLIEELRGVGVQATGYEQLGINGIDADLPQPVSQDVRAVLQRHGMPVPRDGVLRVEIAAPGSR